MISADSYDQFISFLSSGCLKKKVMKLCRAVRLGQGSRAQSTGKKVRFVFLIKSEYNAYNCYSKFLFIVGYNLSMPAQYRYAAFCCGQASL